MRRDEEDTYRRNISERLETLHTNDQEILKQVRYTNGKVKKIILALVLIGGVVIGQVTNNTKEVIALLSHFL